MGNVRCGKHDNMHKLNVGGSILKTYTITKQQIDNIVAVVSEVATKYGQPILNILGDVLKNETPEPTKEPASDN